MSKTIGAIGLGIMGGAFSNNLMKDGFEVVGFDLDPAAVERFEKAGGTAVGSPGEVTARAEISFASLPSVAALDSVVDSILADGKQGATIMECGTFPIEDKVRARDRLAEGGFTLLDCPISGTGGQAANKDLTLYASGDEDAYTKCIPAIDGFARNKFFIGEFGNGSKMKYIANLLVAIHNVSSAEAMVVGMKSGIDPQTIYDVISQSAAPSSSMFKVRGKMMIDQSYEPAHMKVEVWQKDMKVIGDFVESLGVSTKLFDATQSIYKEALADGQAMQDTASVCTVLEKLSDYKR